jgi:lactoylglutathione lyase
MTYFGIRVTDLERSLEFYKQLFDLEVASRGESAVGTAIQLRDRRSGLRLELNWYPPGSPYATPYTPGEGLDHIGVRVRNVFEAREQLKKLGIEPATRDLSSGEEIWTTAAFRVFYIKDPDGNFLELYDSPEEPEAVTTAASE